MTTSYFRPVIAVMLRYFYLLRGTPARWMPVFAWVAIDIVLWGFITRYLNSIASSGLNFVPTLLGPVLLFDFFTRIMHGVAGVFLEDVWSRSFLNLFASPLTIPQYLLGLVVTSTVTSLIGLMVMLVLATAVFGLSFFAYGLTLAPFLLILFLFGVSLGICTCAMVLRLGPSAEWLVWPVPAVISPFAGVFYPISILPHWMQFVGKLLPVSYVFEGLRTIISGGAVPPTSLILGGGLAVAYVLLACWIFKCVFRHNVRLVLLWFGTWKNGSPHYMPLWTKNQTNLYTHIMGNRGRTVDSPKPLAEEAMRADMKAFSALMRHLKSVDPIHTVIMIQVENEPGAWGSIRDYSPEAEKAMAAPVPAEFLKALAGRNGANSGGGDWRTVFGDNADEYFHAYCVAHYIGQVAAAGKAEYPLPMYVNAALRDPLTNPRAGTYESGGATDNVLDIWKAAAPAIDLLAPDIYQNDPAKYLAVLDHYARPDNTLFVPETGSTARMCFAALGRGTIGWSPFGLDYTRATPESLAPVGIHYRMLEPIMREVARLNFEGKVKAVEEEAGQTSAKLDFGTWSAIINFRAAGGGRGGRGSRGGRGMAAANPADANATDSGAAAPPPPPPTGCALVAQISENQFFIIGCSCTIEFQPASGAHRDFLRVEEAAPVERTTKKFSAGSKPYSADSAFRVMRILNGDETDHAMPFGTNAETLRVTLGTY